ncbi:ABC transporter substrate-binding protein [Tsukamurella pseudospumae]|uniref:ABC transporter substrate-binding protein n=1 Tax=Tsukamurella pseudospumae TaxID=239498 RepID=A0A138AVW7_9ACTN|nr:ABC transporter substrate-binding protein [Tsukamurella pseudospumae]KXO89532.1 ABC transporter substrate-binding protein [Tsukamurella pseudospumae]KXP14585.1 ABC transporter substrate-binding protein [Tsukamurella pseudospumae]
MFTRSRKAAPVAAALMAASLVFAGCSTTSADDDKPAASGEKITVSTNKGDVQVPKNPKRVVVLDNTSAETVKALGITPVAIPKGLFAKSVLGDWISNQDVKDTGTHAEPKFDVIEDVKPDLIIGGYRFAKSEGDIKKIAEKTGAAFIDIAAEDGAPKGRVETMRSSTITLGKIFGKDEQAQQIVADFDKNLEAAKAQATGQSVFLSIVNGGKIDNGAKRMQPFIAPLNLKDVFAGQAGDHHQNSGLTPEAIAQANPQWVIVMDRDAAVPPTDGSKPQTAAETFKAQQAFAGVEFQQKDRIFYLDNDFYLREGIQNYGENYAALAKAIAAKK